MTDRTEVSYTDVPTLNAGWREVAAALDCATSIEDEDTADLWTANEAIAEYTSVREQILLEAGLDPTEQRDPTEAIVR